MGSHKVSVKDAICFIKRAWDSVTSSTILHCWQHIGLIPRTTDENSTSDEDDIPLAELLRQTTTALNIEPEIAMTTEEFLTVDNNAEIFPDMSEDDILNIVRQPQGEDSEDEESDTEPEVPPPTIKETKAALTTIFRFIESEDMEDSDLNLCLALEKRLQNVIKTKSKQSVMTDFFSKS